MTLTTSVDSRRRYAVVAVGGVVVYVVVDVVLQLLPPRYSAIHEAEAISRWAVSAGSWM